MEQIIKWLETPAVERVLVSILVIMIALLIYLIGRRICKAYRRRRNGEEKAKAASSIRSVVYDTIKVSIFALLVLTILQINGVNVTSLIAGVGVASAVIGLALQDFLKDIIMGIHILMDDFYQIGDLVQFADEEGIVEGFNLRTTKVRSIRDGDLITICNRNIDRIIKSGNEVYIHQMLPYELPAGRAVEVMNHIAERIAGEDEIESCVNLGANSFEKSAVDYLLKLVIEKPEAKLRAGRTAHRVIREVLAEEGIAIPYEQLDVHMVPEK